LLPEALRHSAKLRPGHVAVIDGERSLTYSDLRRRTARLANAFGAAFRLERQERIGLLAPNRLEFVEILFGAATSGCVCVPVNPRLSGREVGEILLDAEVRLLIADPAFASSVAAAQEMGFDGPVVWLSGDDQPATSYDALLEAASDTVPARAAQGESDVVLQVYTSGTTGQPKGVMLSHRNLMANSWTHQAERSVVPSDRYLSSAPLCHLAAGSRMLSLVHAGATHVIERAFDAERVVRAIGEGRANSTLAVPAMMSQLLDAAEAIGGARGKLRVLTYGAAPMSVPLLTRAIDVLACDFQQGYGLTESSPTLTLLPPEDHRPDASGKYSERLGSVGREALGVHVRVVDADDNDVPIGEIGEVVARGRNIMEGYWRRPEETAETLRGGWLHTGDLAYADADDYVYLVDRSKDMLVSGGFNVYPREVERQLEEHPWVREVAVVGVPDERWGEVPVAYLVVDEARAAGGDLRPEFEEFLRSRLARYKTPKLYERIDVIPRNASGKILKRELRELAAQSAVAPDGEPRR
jgi:acyl-CoA synthetase (AMP-forming)/AMP-acid ligase II